MKKAGMSKDRELRIVDREFTFRKEQFKIKFHYLVDPKTMEEFTTTELDEINTNQVYNQYRDKHNLPFPDEIKKLREKYNLPATKMSEILGFGVNTYRNYEDGEVPVDANAKLIQLAEDPQIFRTLVRMAGLEESYKKKLIQTIDDIIKQEAENKMLELKPVLYNENVADEFTGYRKPNLERITEMIVYFTEKLQPWKTQLNKLLFYADFLNFKNSGYSISGMHYRAIDMGPVIADFNAVFDYCAERNHVDVTYTVFENGTGEQFTPHKKRKFNKAMFDTRELEMMESVVKKFGKMKTKQIVDYSHKEKAWKENQKKHELISYKWAFEIN
jgi:DNA-binding transcriptional regulator YiaG/uncharacterized phage-associated protein